MKASQEQVFDIAKQAILSDESREKCLTEIKALSIDLVAVGHGPPFDLRL